MASRRQGNGWRHALSVICIGIAALLLPVGLLADWAHSTFFDSGTFSTRAVDLLDSPRSGEPSPTS